MQLYHATTLKAACKIQKEGKFRPGTRGYAGGAIYFAAKADSAKKHAFNGVNGNPGRKVEVVIRCKVDLGRCLSAKRHTVDKSTCMEWGYDSVQVKDTDTYAVYDPRRIVIEELLPINKDVAFPPSNKTSPNKMSSEAAGQIIVNAIQQSAGRCLDASSDMTQLYLQHPGLREALGASLKKFCEAHAELIWDHQSVHLAPRQAPAQPRREDATALHKVRAQLRKEYRCRREEAVACRRQEQCAQQEEARAWQKEEQQLMQKEARARQQEEQRLRLEKQLRTQQQEELRTRQEAIFHAQQQEEIRIWREAVLRRQQQQELRNFYTRQREEAERSQQLSINNASAVSAFFGGIAHVLCRLLGFK